MTSAFTPRPEMLRIQDLHAFYGESHILHGIDLKVARGECVTLLGRNGSGRSTTLKSVLGLVGRRTGSIMVNGREVIDQPTHRMARFGIGYVPEERAIFASLSTEENLMLPPQVASGALSVDEIYGMFPNLYERRSSPGSKLSGGEQQMLAIARALSTNPRLLILDEATEGLAPVIRDEIWRCLALLKAQGQTTLVVDKYIDKLLPLADRNLILERGRIAWQGTSAELDARRELWARYLGV